MALKEFYCCGNVSPGRVLVLIQVGPREDRYLLSNFDQIPNLMRPPKENTKNDTVDNADNVDNVDTVKCRMVSRKLVRGRSLLAKRINFQTALDFF